MSTNGEQSPVHEGRDGHLFLVGGRHSVLEYATGRKRVPDDVYAAFRANIDARRRSCEARGIRYAHIIFPDKQSVLAEQFGHAAITPLGLSFCALWRDEPSPVVYPLDALKAAQREDEVYQKLDTHLSDSGALACMRALVAKAVGDVADARLQGLRARIVERVEYSGDLGSKLEPARMAEKTVLARDWPMRLLSNRMAGGNDGIIDIVFSRGAALDRRLLIFGDSFFRASLIILSACFSEILFLRTRYFHDELVELARPDVVFTGNVERYLPDAAPDSARPNALLYPHFKPAPYQPPADFVAALDAMLAASFDPQRCRNLVARLFP